MVRRNGTLTRCDESCLNLKFQAVVYFHPLPHDPVEELRKLHHNILDLPDSAVSHHRGPGLRCVLQNKLLHSSLGTRFRSGVINNRTLCKALLIVMSSCWSEGQSNQ